MLGRAAYHEPWLLAELEHALWSTPLRARRAVLDDLAPYADELVARGERLHHLTRHLVGLFQGEWGARAWRRVLSEQGNRDGADWDVVLRAIAAMGDGPGREAA
jgi:tRNA-dihydrouridine synthase A